MVGEPVRGHARQQRPADPEVCDRALALGDERVGRLLNPVVEEGIRTLHAQDQPGADGFEKRSVDLLSRLSEDHTQCRDLGHVPETGELLESGLRPVGQSLELPHHEIHNVGEVALGANPVQVPNPSGRIPVEPEQPFFGKRRKELNGEKWIASSLVVDQLRQRFGALRFAVERIGN